MKKRTTSKILHILAILSFLLPFFYNGCGGPSAEELAKKAADSARVSDSIAQLKFDSSRIADSIAMTRQPINDSTSKNLVKTNKIETTDLLTKQDSQNDSVVSKSFSKNENKCWNEMEDSYSDELITEYPFLSIILKPNTDTYTGLGSVFNMFCLIYMFSLTISFILLIIGLLIKFIEPSAFKTAIVLEIFILIGIIITEFPSFSYEKLWGYWIALSLASLLLLYDIYIIIKNKLNANTNYENNEQ